MKVDIRQEGGVVHAAIEGWADSGAAQELAEKIQPLMQLAGNEIVIDCAGLQYISSMGLRTFLTLRKECAAKGGKVVIANVNKQVGDIFRMTGFYNLFDIR